MKILSLDQIEQINGGANNCDRAAGFLAGYALGAALFGAATGGVGLAVLGVALAIGCS